MARIARLLCVFCVVSLSSSAMAGMISITDLEPANNSMVTATDLTAARSGEDPIGGIGTLGITATDADYFKVDLKSHDYFMVNTFALDPAVATAVTLYNADYSVFAAAAGPAGYISTSSTPGIYYIGVTATGTAPYMMSFSVDHVPEPATMSLLALGGLAVLRKRRK
jgi:hypothetical protein